MAEVGVATAIGVRAPDVAWCSNEYLAAHPEELPLSAAPELCVEIVSATNALPKLREKAIAYVNAGAREAWLVYPASRRVEIYGRTGRLASTTFAVDPESLVGGAQVAGGARRRPRHAHDSPSGPPICLR